MTSIKKYALYWHDVESEFDLPELSTHLIGGNCPIISVRRGAVPFELRHAVRSGSWWQANESEVLYRVPNIARYHIELGIQITVEMEQGAVERDMRVYLLGMAFATLLYQREILPLHASSLWTPKGAIAFTGPSGAGKSTTVASLHSKTGWPIISDDIAVVKMVDGQAIIHSGVLRLKLWRDAIERLGFENGKYHRDLSRIDKFHIDISESFHSKPEILTKIFNIAQNSNAPGEIKGTNSFMKSLFLLYRPELSKIAGRRLHIEKVVRIIDSENIKSYEGDEKFALSLLSSE